MIVLRDERTYPDESNKWEYECDIQEDIYNHIKLNDAYNERINHNKDCD